MIPIAKPIIDEVEKRYVMEVLDSGMLTAGKVVQDFEAAFTKYTGAKHGTACANGTVALHLGLAASGIKEGDKVLTTPFTFIATANSILYCNAIPVFCDVREDDFNIDPDEMRRILEKDKDIKAVLLVHLFGNPCRMEEILKIAKEYNLIVVEDCAQAHGARYDDKHVGTFGATGTFSFYPTKNMTTAEGGMVVTNSDEVYKNLKLLREHGMTSVYEYETIGYNYRMTNIEAAIGMGQMEKLNKFNATRAENARYYNEHLADLDWLEIPSVESRAQHCYHQYTLKVRDRDRFTEHLKENGIGFKVFYPSTIPDSPFYKKLGYSSENLPVARRMAKEVVSIPVHPGVSQADREKVVEVIRSFKPATAKI